MALGFPEENAVGLSGRSFSVFLFLFFFVRAMGWESEKRLPDRRGLPPAFAAAAAAAAAAATVGSLAVGKSPERKALEV